MGEPSPPRAGFLPAPSALLTTHWAHDRLLTPAPAGLYRGSVRQVISERSLHYALERLASSIGPFRPTSIQQGYFTWRVTVEAEGGARLLNIPRVLDEPDHRGRCHRLLPALMAAQARELLDAGLTGYLVPPERVIEIDGSLPVLLSWSEPRHEPITFERGCFRSGPSGGGSTCVEEAATVELLTQVVAALVYHYRPALDGGTAIADVSFNDGDFCKRSAPGEPLTLGLSVVRRLERGIAPSSLVLQLLQLYAYERVHIAGDDLALPVLISNPGLAFAGIVRGWRKRASDLTLSQDDAEAEARSWLQAFARSPVGRSYRPWVERFLVAELRPTFGDDPREGRLDLAPLRQRQHVHALAGTWLTRPDRAARALELEGFIAEEEARMQPQSPTVAGPRRFAEHLEEAALRTFPTFERYMDLCLHDPVWGYYARRVQIGHSGHFITHPEALSPDYGGWLAEWALRARRDLLQTGRLGPSDRFVVVEFGAGNGRLARDVLDAVRRRSAEDGADAASWGELRACLDYRIYELSATLMDSQRALLGSEATVAFGDARDPRVCLERDFPGGLCGLVFTNEVPDAFGVHKVLLHEGGPWAVLVVPRLESGSRASLAAPLSRRIAAAHERILERLELDAIEGAEYLDQATFEELMIELAALDGERRTAVLEHLWFDEICVRAEQVPDLARHLAEQTDGSAALAGRALAAPRYVNVHGGNFVRGLGAALAAGFVITIDYGGSSRERLQALEEGRPGLRVYGEAGDEWTPTANDPYAFPGMRDLTTDVDFDELGRAGEAVGLEVLYYGPETSVAGPALRDVLGSSDPRWSPLLDESGFKVLVQGTHASAFWQSGASPRG